MSRIPARLRPAYQADPWVVRGKFVRTYQKTKLVTRVSKPKRTIKNTNRLLRTRLPTTTSGANWFPEAAKTVNRRTHVTAAAHSLRSKARRRTRKNRAASQTIGAIINIAATSATIARAPRNIDCGPGDGC